MTSVDLGADLAGVRRDGAVLGTDPITAVRRRALTIAALPGLPHALAVATAVGVAAVAARDAGAGVWLAVAAVLATLVLDLSTQPLYERARAHGSGKRLVAVGGIALLGASSVEVLTPVQVRWSIAVVLCAAVVVTCIAALAGAVRGPRAVLLVGGRAGVAELITHWSSCREVEVRGACLPEFGDESAHEIVDVPILGSLDDVVDIAVALGVDQVVVAPGPLLSGQDVRRLSWRLESSSIELSVAPEVDGVVPRRVVPRLLGRRLMLSVRPSQRTRPALWVRGVLDRMAAAVLLVVLSPVLLLVMIVIRRDSRGPVIFRQTRVGIGGEPFECLKFRTMVVGAEAMLAALASRNEGAGPMFKLAADPRITGVGSLLRRTSLDELPQLVNVLKGEMSLIGPRPALPTELVAYDEWVRRRLHVKPGMTGAWQVGGRSRLSWTDSVRLDIDYVDNARLREDLWIAAKTARVVIVRDGAV